MKLSKLEKKVYFITLFGVVMIVGSFSRFLSLYNQIFLTLGFGVMLRGIFMYIKASGITQSSKEGN